MMDLPAPVSPVSTVSPGCKFELDRVDDREVANLEIGEHAVPCAQREGSTSAATPVKLRAQQAVVVVIRRMQQRDAFLRRVRCRARRRPAPSLPSTHAVARDLRVRVVALDQLDFDRRARRDDDRPVRHRVRADRRHHQHVEMRLDDRAAAGQRIRRGAGGRRDDDAVAGVRVDEPAVHARFEIQHAAGGGLLQNDVVEPERLDDRAIAAMQAGAQQRALFARELAFEGGVDVRQHVLRHDVGEEAEPAAVDAEERHVVTGHQARAVEQGAVAADGDEQVRLLGELLLPAGA